MNRWTAKPKQISEVNSRTLSSVSGINTSLPAIFLDRDGTLIEEINLLHKVSDIRPYKFAITAIQRLNSFKKYVIILTNQSVVARGLCTEDDIKMIHKYIMNIFTEQGATIHAIYFCPHHPEKGFAGENELYKKKCDCRKPRIGLIEKACKDFPIDLKHSWVIGDQTVDIEMGKRVGINTVLVNTGYGGKDKKYPCQPTTKKQNILEAVNYILAQENK